MSSVQQVLSECSGAAKTTAIALYDGAVGAVKWGAYAVSTVAKGAANFAVNTYNWAKPFFTDKVFPFVSNTAKALSQFVWNNRNYFGVAALSALFLGALYYAYQACCGSKAAAVKA